MAFAWTVDTGGTLNTNFLAAYNLSSTTDDKSGITLTNVGTTTFTTGKNGNAADLGASNTTKSLKVDNNISYAGGAYSISGWFNVTTAPGSGAEMIGVSVTHGTTDFSSLFIGYFNNGGTFQAEFIRDKVNVGSQGVTANQTLTAGTWYHMVLTYDGSTVQGWVNGSSLGTAAASGNGSTGGNTYASTFAIGGLIYTPADTYLRPRWSGLVDACYLWNKKLSDTEVADLYNSGTGSFYIESVVGPTNLKTWNGLAKASIKTLDGLAIASTKTWNGLT